MNFCNKEIEITRRNRYKHRKLIIPVFVPHLGCPHDCCFCNQRTISGKAEAPTAEGVIKIIESYSDISENYGSVEVAFYGGSFTAIPENLQKMYLGTARSVLGDGVPFRVSTRPDYIDDIVLERLTKYGVRTVELGAQSMCNDVLKASGRGHLSEDTIRASKIIREYGLTLGLQTMLGLPGASRNSEIYTAQKIIEQKPELVRIYPTVVLEGTELDRMYKAGEYEAMKLSDAVDICAEIIPMYEDSGITVIRTGLQSSDNISADGKITGGPYHPAFGELVRSKIALNWLVEQFPRLQDGKEADLYFRGNRVKILYEKNSLILQGPEHLISQFVGQHRSNINTMQKIFGCNLKVSGFD